jgi:hypothetical protein
MPLDIELVILLLWVLMGRSGRCGRCVCGEHRVGCGEASISAKRKLVLGSLLVRDLETYLMVLSLEI